MEPGLVSHARMCSAQVVAGPMTRSSEAPAATPLSSMRIVCVGVIPVLSPAWRCAGSLCHYGSGVEAAFRQKRAARSGTVTGRIGARFGLV